MSVNAKIIQIMLDAGMGGEENLVAACRSCNSSKCDKLLSEWGGPLQ